MYMDVHSTYWYILEAQVEEKSMYQIHSWGKKYVQVTNLLLNMAGLFEYFAVISSISL
jgi:hypothetical protein